MNDALWKFVREARANLSKAVNAHELGADDEAMLRLETAFGIIGMIMEKVQPTDAK